MQVLLHGLLTVHGDIGANDGPRERSMIEEGTPAEKSTVTKYREKKSGRL
jgi:hypothetical protein